MSKMLNTFDVAGMLGVSPEQIRRMYRRGEIPGKKFTSTCIVYDFDEIQNLINIGKLKYSEAANA